MERTRTTKLTTTDRSLHNETVDEPANANVAGLIYVVIYNVKSEN